MSDLVGNPEDRFSHNEAHLVFPQIESYSSEDEDEDGGRKQQVKVDVHTHKKAGRNILKF